MELKQTIEDYDSNVQQLNLRILRDFQVQMFTEITRKMFESMVDWFDTIYHFPDANDHIPDTTHH